MDKIKVDKRIRIYIAIILVLATVVSILILYSAYNTPDTVLRETIVADYIQTGDFDYIVNLRPNQLYDAQSIGEGLPYFTKITDDIGSAFSYKLMVKKGKNVNIKGDYNAEAILSTDLWEKRYIVTPKKEFSGQDNIYFNDTISIDVEHYDSISTSISKDLGVQSKESKLTIVYNINTIVDKDGRQVKNTFSPSILITSTKGAFKIEGNLTNKNESSIVNLENEPRFDVIGTRLNSIIAIVILIFISIIFSTATVNKLDTNCKKDNECSKIANIRKEYGDIIVFANNSELPNIQHKIVVGSIDELVKVAEQLDNPIINSGSIYYIFDGSTLYIYSI